MITNDHDMAFLRREDVSISISYGDGFYSIKTYDVGLSTSVSTFAGDTGLTMGITLANPASDSPGESQDSQEWFTEELLEKFINSRVTYPRR
jgi:hypothetical protein